MPPIRCDRAGSGAIDCRVLVASITAVTLALRGMTKGIEFVTEKIQDWGPTVASALGIRSE